MYMKNNILTLLLMVLLLSSPLFAYDVSDLGDFSQRSVIENTLFNNQPLNQEQKDILTAKKLYPTQKCLFEQIKKGDYENVELLLKAKINPNQSYLGEHAIYVAAKENNFEMVKLLYENKAQLDRGFYSELYEAVKNKNKDMAQYLLDRGAKVNYMDAITNDSVLYKALKNKMYDISSQLIAKGAYADMKSVKYIKKHKLAYLIPDK